MTAQMVLSALIGLPGLIWTDLPADAAWPWVAGSTALNLVTVTALLRAYDLVGFGMAYPVVRALSVLTVVPLAALLSGEMLSLCGFTGIALVVVSLFLLAFGNKTEKVPRAAFLWIAVAGVSAAAYTNNDLSPASPATTGTTLFVLDATLDQIALQSPPNVGTLVATGKLTVDASALSGFDIYSTVRDNVTLRNRALATLVEADGTVGLYNIDVLTGKASSRGKLPAGTVVIDIAVPLYQD